MFHGFRGHGAFINDAPITLRKNLSFQNSLLALGYNLKIDKEEFQDVFQNIITNNLNFFRNGSGALMGVYAACSRVICFYEPMINSWDISATRVIAEEAGCFVSDFFDDEKLLKGESKGNRILICAPQLAEEVKKIVKWKE